MSMQSAANAGVGGSTVIDGVTISAEDRALNEAVMKCNRIVCVFCFKNSFNLCLLCCVFAV